MATPITSSPAVRAASTRAGVAPKRCIPDTSLTTTRPSHPARAARWASLPIVSTGSVLPGGIGLGGTRVGVSTTGVTDAGSPSSSWIVPTAIVSANSAATPASHSRPKP